MKNKITELDVDTIGTQGSTLTKAEERAISAYIREHKSRIKLKSSKRKTKV